jgi:hypothetical protein
MTDAVTVSTARTPIGKAYKGALNNTEGATLMGHVISAALSRPNVEGGEVEVRPEAISREGYHCVAVFRRRSPERPSIANAPLDCRQLRSQRAPSFLTASRLPSTSKQRQLFCSYCSTKWQEPKHRQRVGVCAWLRSRA